MQRRTRRSFTLEFKDEVVRLTQGDANVVAVAHTLDLDVSTLRDWVRRARHSSPDGAVLLASERQELAQLRRENAVLKMEREILKNSPGGLLRPVEPETPGVLSPLLLGRSDRLLFGDARAR